MIRFPNKLKVGALILGIGFLGVLGLYLRPVSEQVACTQEAKLCPADGSLVGRTGPNCEFAPCPSNDLWKTTIDTKQGISYQYPDHLLTKYTTAQAWPPVVKFEQRNAYPCPKNAQQIDGRFFLPIKDIKIIIAESL